MVARIGYQGVAGAYSHQALEELFCSSVPDKLNAGSPKLCEHSSFAELHAALHAGDVDFAFIPIENSLAGTIHTNYDLMVLAHRQTQILGEYVYQISHCVLAVEGVKLSDIRFVASHPQALAQCRAFIHDTLKAHEIQAFDTAGAAQLLCQKETERRAEGTPRDKVELSFGFQNSNTPLGGARPTLGNTAVLASSHSGKLYGLEILQAAVQDMACNFTRFLLIGHLEVASTLPLLENRSEPQQKLGPRPANPAKSSLIFTTSEDQKAGTLAKYLAVFSLHEINICKLESRPLPRELLVKYLRHRPILSPCRSDSVIEADLMAATASFRVVFVIDIDGSIMEPNVALALKYLDDFSPFVHILGSYPKFCSHATSKDIFRKIIHNAVPFAPTTSLPGKKGNGAPDSVASNLRAEGKPTMPPSLSPTSLQLSCGTVSSAVAANNSKLIIGFVGFGPFAQFLAKRLAWRGHRVYATSRRNYAKEDTLVMNYGFHFRAGLDLEWLLGRHKLDVLIIAVSILSFAQVTKTLPVDLLSNVLVVDVLSVKVFPRETLLQLGNNFPILCCHPMFGPDSGAGVWQNLPFVYERVRGCVCPTDSGTGTADQLLSFFGTEGCRLIEMDCSTHDRLAAASQFVTHLTGRVLLDQDLADTPIDTVGFRALKKLVRNTASDSFDLFKGLYKYNANSEGQLEKFQATLQDIRRRLCETDSEEVSCDVVPFNSSPISILDEPPTKKSTNLSSEAKLTTGSAASDSSTNSIKLQFSASMLRSKYSATGKIFQRIQELESSGRKIHSLAVGMPNYDPPRVVVDGYIFSFKSYPCFQYSPTCGLASLRNAIAEDLNCRLGTQYGGRHICLAGGAKQIIYQTILAICNPGDEIIIPTPTWVSYYDIAKSVGASPILVPLDPDENFTLHPNQLVDVLSSKTKLIILCNPSNPLGTCKGKPELLEIAKILQRPEFLHVRVLSDEIYERLSLGNEPHVCFATLPGMEMRTIVVNGFSKSFAMCGSRLGYVACLDLDVVQANATFESLISSCPNTVAQIAALKGLLNPGEVKRWFEFQLGRLRSNRDTMKQTILAHVPDARIFGGQAAFYLFLEVGRYLPAQPTKADRTDTQYASREITDDSALAEYLLTEEGVAVIPGSAFQYPGFLRLSFAAPIETVEAGAKVIGLTLASFKKQRDELAINATAVKRQRFDVQDEAKLVQ